MTDADEWTVRDPVALACFMQGGSNILWNLLSSHPDLCHPLCELHEPFARGLGPIRRIFGVRSTMTKPAFVVRGVPLWYFDTTNTRPRPRLPARAEKSVRDELLERKMLTLDQDVTNEMTPGVKYTAAEVAAARLCLKATDGIVLTLEGLRSIWRSLDVVVLYRAPEPLYESWQRRGKVRSVDDFLKLYRPIAEAMLAMRSHATYVEFDQLLADPFRVVCDVGRRLGHDFESVTHFRLRSKGHYRDGRYWKPDNANEHTWYDREELTAYLNQDISETQSGRVPGSVQDRISDATADIRERFREVATIGSS